MSTENHNHITPGQPAGPCMIVVFGAGGDLTKRKLLPALYNLAQEKLLPENFAVLGFGRSPWSNEEFRKKVIEALEEFEPTGTNSKIRDWILERCYYFSGDFNDAAAFVKLKEMIDKIDKERNTGGNILHYFAIAPEFFGLVVRQLTPRGSRTNRRAIGAASSLKNRSAATCNPRRL